MKWDECLMKEAKDLTSHGEGSLELVVSPRGGNKTLVIIRSGKSYRFVIDGADPDDDN